MVVGGGVAGEGGRRRWWKRVVAWRREGKGKLGFGLGCKGERDLYMGEKSGPAWAWAFWACFKFFLVVK